MKIDTYKIFSLENYIISSDRAMEDANLPDDQRRQFFKIIKHHTESGDILASEIIDDLENAGIIMARSDIEILANIIQSSIKRESTEETPDYQDIPVPKPPTFVSPQAANIERARIERIRPKPHQGTGDPYREEPK